MKKNTRRLIMLLFAAVFAVSAALLGRDLVRSNREKADNRALARQVEQVRNSAEDARAERAVGAEATSEEELLAEYAALAGENSDLPPAALCSWMGSMTRRGITP